MPQLNPNHKQPNQNFIEFARLADFSLSNCFPVSDNLTVCEVENIANIPVFTLSSPDKDRIINVLSRLGDNTLVRIISSNFINDALEFGTDKARLDIFDYRRISEDCGYDIWSVENRAKEHGYSVSDVICAAPISFFIEERLLFDYSSTGLGIPTDRSAILIYDSSKLREILETDGYLFADPLNKKEALLGIIQFKPQLNDLDRSMVDCNSFDEKLVRLRKEVYENIKEESDLTRFQDISFRIVGLLCEQSVQGNKNNIDQLVALADRMQYEKKMLGFYFKWNEQLQLTNAAYQENNPKKVKRFATWPDYLIRKAEELLKSGEVDLKYDDKFRGLISEAKAIKVKYSL